MVSKRHKGRGPAEISVLIFLAIAFLAGGYLHASNGAGGSGLGRYRVFSLKFIPAKTGKDYLAKAGIGTVSQLPGANTLLVTASQEELLKATAILRLVDSDAQFVLETIQPAGGVEHQFRRARQERFDIHIRLRQKMNAGNVTICYYSIRVPLGGIIPYTLIPASIQNPRRIHQR